MIDGMVMPDLDDYILSRAGKDPLLLSSFFFPQGKNGVLFFTPESRKPDNSLIIKTDQNLQLPKPLNGIIHGVLAGYIDSPLAV